MVRRRFEFVATPTAGATYTCIATHPSLNITTATSSCDVTLNVIPDYESEDDDDDAMKKNTTRVTDAEKRSSQPTVLLGLAFLPLILIAVVIAVVLIFVVVVVSIVVHYRRRIRRERRQPASRRYGNGVMERDGLMGRRRPMELEQEL